MIRAPLLFSALAAVLTPGLAHAHGGHDHAAGMAVSYTHLTLPTTPYV